jgi:hypothetical protein
MMDIWMMAVSAVEAQAVRGDQPPGREREREVLAPHHILLILLLIHPPSSKIMASMAPYELSRIVYTHSFRGLK